ncbi:sulfatase-like hydrolase/transferase [Thalassotalea montiporae]
MMTKVNTMLLVALALLVSSYSQADTQKPNIVIIYADDLGVGDVSAYQMGKLQTPNIDEIAKQGLKFNQGYATAATCTPSRYSLLTGQYPWRKNAKILPGDAPLLIDPAQETLPKMLKRAGYRTGIVGKWHLGLGHGQVDWNQTIALGPNQVGFDYSYIMAATNDRVPNVYLENGAVIGLEPDDPLYVSYQKNFANQPTGLDNPELMTKMKFSNGHFHSINNGIPRIGYQTGGKKAQWRDEDMSDLFLAKATEFIDAQVVPTVTLKNQDQNQPFFLFYSLHQPHVPRVPHQRFAGSSGLGPRGDAILEADWAIGQLIEHLAQQGLARNTLVIFSSDNGPVLDDGYQDQAVSKNGEHTPWGIYRGGKYSLFDAGAHVPLLASWPGTIEANSESEQLFSQLDLLASLSALTQQPVSNNDTLDSENHLSTLLGKSAKGRKALVVQALGGRTAYREQNWLFIPAYWGDEKLAKEDIETGACSCYQLYDLANDPGQQTNLAEKYPEKTKAMKAAYMRIMATAD